MHALRTMTLFAAVAIGLGACGDESGGTAGVDRGTDELKGDRGEVSADPRYLEVDPAFPLSSGEQATLHEALDVLVDLAESGTSGRQRALAAETVGRIASGQVRISALETARGIDLWHMCKDLVDVACPVEPPDDPAWAGDESLQTALVSQLDGYQWSYHLYFAIQGRDPAGLAATLVHEVGHVLNRSECSYFSDFWTHAPDDTWAWLEEYRAFVAECVLARGRNGTAARCDDWSARQLVEREYGFSPDLAVLLDDPEEGTVVIAKSLFEDDGVYGWLIPTADLWPTDFDECGPIAAE